MRLCRSLLVIVSLVGTTLAVSEPAGAAEAWRAHDGQVAPPTGGQSQSHGRTGAAASRLTAEQVAVAKAKATGRPVEVAGERTATSTVFAEPSGLMRAIITTVPTRVRRGRSWIPVSTALRKTNGRGAGGAIRPVAISAPLTLSGGGAASPLVSLGSGSSRLDLRWPGKLPAPVVSGSTATYRQVRPGVDLEVTAKYAGFDETLVVRDRAAALRLLAAPPSLKITSPGLTVKATRGGGLVAADRSGKVVFTAPPAAMWDSSPANPVDGSVRTAPVGLALRGDRIWLRPDRAMLTSPATRFPVMIDPSFSAGLLNWVDPLQLYPNEQTWNGENLGTDSNGVVEVGLDPYYGTIARAMFQMNTSSVNGKHILGATFRITEGWANSCTASAVDLWIVGGIGSGTTWNNQPSWMQYLSSVTAAHRTDHSGSCGTAPIAFDATAGVQAASANGWPNLTLGLRGDNEGDTNSWKRFYPDATLQIDYNSISTVGTQSTNPPLSPQCVSGGSQPASNDPYMNSQTPTLIAYANDADTAETDLKGTFVWQSWNGSAWVARGSGTDPIARAANTQTSFTIPSGSLTDGTTYRWQVQVADPLMAPYNGTDYSAWSPWCEFIADFSPPPPPTVSGAVYTSGCAPSCGGVGQSGSFTLSASGAPDVTKYYYGFTDPPSIALTPSSTGGSVTFGWTPTAGGPTTLYVQSQDAGSNISAETRYSFTVGAPMPALGSWRLNGDLSDDTGAHPLSQVGNPNLSAPGVKVQDSALGLSGSGQYAQTSGPVLDTTKSFSVSAWVKLTDNSTYREAVSQVGTNTSNFVLEYDYGRNRWTFAGFTPDASNPNGNYVVSSLAPPTLGAWTLLTGTYDAGTGTARLYVNGVLQNSQVATGPYWNATGPLLIGADVWNGARGSFWQGSISNVAVWQRVLQPSEVSALADPTSDPVGVWNFEELGGSMAFDSSPGGYGNDLTLEGDAQIPGSGAGHDGLGLSLPDGRGWAQTTGVDNGGFVPVLHTDQSFTVSAWVRLDGSSLPGGNEYAISQAGTTASAFSLGYVASPSPHWDFMMAQADKGEVTFDNAASPVPLTTADLHVWHLLTGTFNAQTNAMRLSVDGSVVATTTRTVAPWNAAGALLVGAGWYHAADAGLWTGAIDDARAYQGLLNQPLGDWQFDSCTGTPVTCADQGSGNHLLTLGSGVTWTPGSYTNSGLTLAGSGLATTSGTVVDTSSAFTASAWVNLAAVPNSDAIVVAQAGAKQDFFELGYQASTGEWCATVYSADSGTATASSACGGSVTTGVWTQIAGTFDPVSQTITLYIDGSPVATASDNAAWKAAGWFFVGGGWRNNAATGYVTGRIDDVQILSGVVADPSTLQ